MPVMTSWQIVYSSGDATWSHLLAGTYAEANQHAQAECQRFPGARFYISEEFKPTAPQGEISDREFKYVTLCTTGDCPRLATFEVDIYDGVSDTPTIAPYCALCASALSQDGETVRLLQRRHALTAANQVMAYVQTYGERIQALEDERQRYRSALVDALGWIPADQPEHMRISRLLRDSDV